MKGNMDQATKDKMLNALRTRYLDQITGAFYRGDRAGCAVGIMAEALGFDRKMLTVSIPVSTPDTNPALFLQRIGLEGDFLKLIVDRNDVLHWSFKRIADWLESAISVVPRLNFQEIEDYANSAVLV